MKILSIETSCDETAISLIDIEGDIQNAQFSVLGNALLSQAKIHEEYGGVFPTLARREHEKNLVPLLLNVLKESKLPSTPQSSKVKDIEKILERESELKEQFLQHIAQSPSPNIDAIAVTQGPGLEPALWVGINFAKALSVLWNKPLIPVNHMEGHLLTGLVENGKLAMPALPALALLISGGHTEIVLMKKPGIYEIIGETKDDAVGEAFDKAARMLDLPYPGGPEISRLAEEARKENLQIEKPLPRPMMGSNDISFSFSGLKTSVLYLLRDNPRRDDEFKKMIARDFEDSVCDVFEKKIRRAVEETGAHTLILGGGVSANKEIRKRLSKLAQEMGITIKIPDVSFTGDNALMIALGGFIRSQLPKAFSSFKADGGLRIGPRISART